MQGNALSGTGRQRLEYLEATDFLFYGFLASLVLWILFISSGLFPVLCCRLFGSFCKFLVFLDVQSTIFIIKRIEFYKMQLYKMQIMKTT
jgi:hypothetical protein